MDKKVLPLSTTASLWSISLVCFLVAAVWDQVQKVLDRLKPAPDTSITNRNEMLSRVQGLWIKGFLENDLYYDKELLPLGLCRRVGDRWVSVLENPLELCELLSSGKKISEVFDEADGKLLILGEGGGGKTTLLLELVRDLLEQLKDPYKDTIPVVLNLSSWATKQLSLKEWIIEELHGEMYQRVPRHIAQNWVDNSQLLLLLDGLDEVSPNAQAACIQEVNKYLKQANRFIVVCSRTKEYLEQPERLSLRTAVSIQPLSYNQIDEYLNMLGGGVSGLRSALQQSETLRALVTTPLFLKILILTYHGKEAQDLLTLVNMSAVGQQYQLFHDSLENLSPLGDS